jgi:hypothetical protein
VEILREIYKKNLFNALFRKEGKINIFYIGEFKTADFVECNV